MVAACKWARLDSNQGPTDYERTDTISAGLGLSGETARRSRFRGERSKRVSRDLGWSCYHAVTTIAT